MSKTISPAEALTRIPAWDGDLLTFQELKGGLTNRTYLVGREGQSYVLRLDAEHTTAFNLDRVCETEILKQAAKVKIAPKVIFADEGILLTEYLTGRIWDERDLEDQAQIESLAELLNRVHALPLCGTAMDANRIAAQYAENLVPHPDLHGFGTRCQQIIADIERSGERCCCHNDLVAANVIESSKLMLLDWEYACDNDPLFDLASLIGYHNLSRKTAGNFLSAYAGGSNPELAERLEAQTRLYDAMHWLWLANRQQITGNAEQATRLQELQRQIGVEPRLFRGSRSRHV